MYSEVCNNLCDPKIDLKGRELMLNCSAICSRCFIDNFQQKGVVSISFLGFIRSHECYLPQEELGHEFCFSGYIGHECIEIRRRRWVSKPV